MVTSKHILIVDDDNRIIKLLKKFLQQNGYSVSTASSGLEALEILNKEIFDLIILDVMMPNITGIELAYKIKNLGMSMPIVMLTALSELDDKIKGLEAGASDYITKPFEPRELLLRIHNLINTHEQYKPSQNIVKFGTCSYNLDNKLFTKRNAIVNLSSTEQKLLDILSTSLNIPLSREGLSASMGGLNERSIDVQIVRLRNKIEDDPKSPRYLKTIRHQGYALYS